MSSNSDFADLVAGCLDKAPVDGLCKEYGGHSFGGSDRTIGSMPDWDVSAVTDMEEAFRGHTSFNGDLSNWNVAQVTNMYQMFRQAQKFNQDIGSWDVS